MLPRRTALVCVFTCLSAAIGTNSSFAQSPTLAIPTPLGMQRGTSLELTLTGTNLTQPIGLWTSFPAKTTIPTDHDNGKDSSKVRVRIDVPKDAPLGFHSIRLTTMTGISNFRLFCIDDLPQVLAGTVHHTRSTAMAVPVPSVVVGRAETELSDYYKIVAKAGQRISFEILGRRLGSAFDPQITLLDPLTGRELAYNNDAPGLQTDARLTHTFKDAGEYLIEVRDATYRGGADFWYRLRIGDFPCATAPIPMAATRGSTVRVEFAGPNVAGVAPVIVQAPSDPAVGVISVAPRGANGLFGWPVALALSDLREDVEREPNNDIAHANRLIVPCGITGRFHVRGDVDHYVFAALKGQRWIIEAHTHEFHSPTDVFMVLKNSAGKDVAAINPAQDPRLDFTVPADGDYYLAVEHLNYWGGPDECYRVTITPYQPGFDAALTIDHFDLPAGGAAVVPIQTVTRRDFNEPIELTLTGPSFLHGRGFLMPGKPAANQPAGYLFVTADENAPVGAQSVSIVAKATIAGKPVVAYANTKGMVSQSLAGLPFPPQQYFRQIGVGITEAPPFRLALHFDHAEQARGTSVPITISATRSAGFTEEIALTPIAFLPNVTLGVKSIPKGQSEVRGQLSLTAAAALGRSTIALIGKAKHEKRDFAVTALPADLVVTLPFDVKVSASSFNVQPGQKTKLKVVAVRHGGYQGPINLEVRNLPANVTASKATIGAKQSTAEIDVQATAAASPATKSDVLVVGKATTAGNQQRQSQPFSVQVIQNPTRKPDGKRLQSLRTVRALP